MKRTDFLISVVMPIYKVEEYLEEAIESVVGQTIGFDENIQLILVNDGSPDNSDEICKRFEARYPDNIIYIEKENGGVSSARNTGMQYAEGKYINFLDADDAWAPDAFDKAAAFFKENNSVRIAAAKPEYFGRADGKKSPLDYVYKESSVINILETPDMPLFGVNRTFFETDIVKKHRFNVEVSISEDQLFLTELVLEQKMFGIVNDIIYRYRKREDNSSALDKAKSNPSYYTVTPEKVFKVIINKSIEEFGEVIPYVQNLMMTDLRFRIKPVPEDILSEAELADYRAVMRSILELVSDDIILDQKGLLFWQRVYYIKAKHGGNIPEASLCKLMDKKLRLQIDTLTIDGSMRIRGTAHEQWLIPEAVIYAEDERGVQYIFDYNENTDNDRIGIFEEPVLKGFEHEIELPLREGAVYSFYIKNAEDQIHGIKPRFGSNVVFSDEKRTRIKSGKNIVTVVDGSIRTEKEKNKYAEILAVRAGITYEEAYEEMKQTKWATGLSFADYLKNDLHGMEEHVRFRTAEKIATRKERKEGYIEEISRYLNVEMREVRREIRRVREAHRDKIDISTAFYHDYELYKKDDASIANSVELLAERKALCTRFREIFDGTEDYKTCISELEKIYKEIKAINDKLLTKTIIDRHREDFLTRYPQLSEDTSLERDIVLDFMTLQNAGGYNNTDFKIYDLFSKRFSEKMEYASNREVARAVRCFNSPDSRAILDDKYGCYNKFREFFGREMISVKSIDSIKEIKSFCRRNSQFVKKPIYSRQGHGIRLVDVSAYKTVKGMVKAVLKEDGGFIAEEVVKGHPLTAAFNSDSLNTLRIVTVNTGTKVRGISILNKAVRKGLILYAGDGVYCCTAFFKTGRSGSFVDNAGSGGCFTAIDLRNGRSSGIAIGEDGREYIVHPDSGISFSKLRFNNISDAVETAKTLALMIPEAGIVGWDFALTEDERWVLIEANYSPTFIGQAPAKCGVGREIHKMISMFENKAGESTEEQMKEDL